MGFDNIDLGFGKLLISYLGGIRDAINNEGFAQINNLVRVNGGLVSNEFVQSSTISDANQSGLYLHTIDARIHDINLLGGQLELIGDFQYLKGGQYSFGNNTANNNMRPLNIGNTPVAAAALSTTTPSARRRVPAGLPPAFGRWPHFTAMGLVSCSEPIL